MSRILLIVMVVVTVILLAVGPLTATKDTASLRTPDGAVRAMFNDVKVHNWNAAYGMLSDRNDVDREAFIRDVAGSHGDLRTFSTLSSVQPKVLHETDNDAMVRADLQWSTAVGAVYSTRDLKTVKDGNVWKIEWPAEKEVNVPPQVIPVNFLRWDVITRGSNDDWGAQNVDPPRVRITSMNAVAHDGGTTILGEIVNEDTVPGFVSVAATLVGKDGQTLGEETSFDKISHVLLPKEVSPFRIDFPKVKLSAVKNVRMTPNSMLVPASADPTIGVLNQRLTTDQNGRKVLQGELINESGQTVNIPHVLATFYDNSGKVIWVSDGYVDRALLPQTPRTFTLGVAPEIASKIQSYRVTVNTYSINRHEEN